MKWHKFNRSDMSSWPPDEGRYLVTIKITRNGEPYSYVDCSSWYAVYGTGISGFFWSGPYRDYVIAWADLPRPYKFNKANN